MAQNFNFQYSQDQYLPDDERHASLPSDTKNHPQCSQEHPNVPSALSSYLSYNNQGYASFQSNTNTHLQYSQGYPNFQPVGNFYGQYYNQVSVNNWYSTNAHQQYSRYSQEFPSSTARPFAPDSYYQPHRYNQEYTNALSNQNLPQTAAMMHRTETMTREPPVIVQSYSQHRQQTAMQGPPMTPGGPATMCQQRVSYQARSAMPDPLAMTGGTPAIWQPEQQHQSTNKTQKSPIMARKPLIAIYVDLTVDKDEAPAPPQVPPKPVKRDRSQMSWLKPSKIHLEKALGKIKSVKDEEDHRTRMEIWNNNNRRSTLNPPALATTRKRKASSPLEKAAKRNQREENDSDKDGECELEKEYVRQKLPRSPLSNTMEPESDKKTVRANSVIEEPVATGPGLKTPSAPEKPKTTPPRKPKAARAPKKPKAAGALTSRNTPAGKVGNHDNDAYCSDKTVEDDAREEALEEIAAECERMLDELDDEEEDKAKAAQTEDEIVAGNLARLQERLDEYARQREASDSETEESDEDEDEKKEESDSYDKEGAALRARASEARQRQIAAQQVAMDQAAKYDSETSEESEEE